MSTTKYTPRLADKYKKEVVPALMKRFNYGTVMQVMGVLSGAGFTKIGLLTDQAQKQP